MDVTLNGEPRQLRPGITVADLVAEVTRSPRSIAVAVDDEVVTRSAWPETTLHHGARVEILTPRQGG